MSVTGIASGSTGDQVYDGEWWLSVDKDQHIGFLVGYIDYYVFILEGPLSFSESWYQYEERVTEHLKNHVADRGKPVTQVLEAIAAKSVRKPTGKRVEKHIFFDGEYWRQGVPSQRLGIIQGFLECQRKDGKAVARFSRSEDWYVAQISQWYGVREADPAEINPEREKKKIADVLYMFKDKPTTPAPAKKKP